MSDLSSPAPAPDSSQGGVATAPAADRWTSAAYQARLRRRRAAAKRFQLWGLMGIGLAALFLVILLTSVISQGIGAFSAAYMRLEVKIDPERAAVVTTPNLAAINGTDLVLPGNFVTALRAGTRLTAAGETLRVTRDSRLQSGQTIVSVDRIPPGLTAGAEVTVPRSARDIVSGYEGMLNDALYARFPEVTGRDRTALRALIGFGAFDDLRDLVADDASVIGQTRSMWVLAADEVDQALKGRAPVRFITACTYRQPGDNPFAVTPGLRAPSAEDGSAAACPETAEPLPQPLPGNAPTTALLSYDQVRWASALYEAGDLDLQLGVNFLTNADSSTPEYAGVLGGVLASLKTLLIVVLLAFPIGVAAAVYLEEFAPKNRWTDILEVNINNLAAIPSIIYGLLGLAIFIGMLGIPRSTPIAAGMVLALMSLPVIIIASRAALKAVPPSIREAALGLGASKQQAVWHHVLPLAMPGMMTGTILAMAMALGETAPLLLIGGIAAIVTVPPAGFDWWWLAIGLFIGGLLWTQKRARGWVALPVGLGFLLALSPLLAGADQPAAVLPVQIFSWARRSEVGFAERSAGAIIILLLFLVFMNAVAIYVRRKFERRW